MHPHTENTSTSSTIGPSEGVKACIRTNGLNHRGLWSPKPRHVATREHKEALKSGEAPSYPPFSSVTRRTGAAAQADVTCCICVAPRHQARTHSISAALKAVGVRPHHALPTCTRSCGLGLSYMYNHRYHSRSTTQKWISSGNKATPIPLRCEVDITNRCSPQRDFCRVSHDCELDAGRVPQRNTRDCRRHQILAVRASLSSLAWRFSVCEHSTPLHPPFEIM